MVKKERVRPINLDGRCEKEFITFSATEDVAMTMMNGINLSPI